MNQKKVGVDPQFPVREQHILNRQGNKQELRAHYREVRRQHHSTSIASFESLTSGLAEILASQAEPSIWALYKAHRSELDLEAAIQHFSSVPSSLGFPGVRWAYPCVTPDGSLQFYIPRASDWIPNTFLILEPNPETAEAIPLSQLAGVFIPGLAFDRFGNRIGSGKGYYDRALSEFRGLRVGVGYSVQISDGTFPAEQHDIQMDCLLTEQGVVKCERSQMQSQTKG